MPKLEVNRCDIEPRHLQARLSICRLVESWLIKKSNLPHCGHHLGYIFQSGHFYKELSSWNLFPELGSRRTGKAFIYSWDYSLGISYLFKHRLWPFVPDYSPVLRNYKVKTAVCNDKTFTEKTVSILLCVVSVRGFLKEDLFVVIGVAAVEMSSVSNKTFLKQNEITKYYFDFDRL